MIPRKKLTVIREEKGALSGGFYAPGVKTNFDIMASVQPADSKDLKMLPEGEHYETVFKLYSCDYVQEEDDIYEADRIIIYGKIYKVKKVPDWDNNLVPHRKILVVNA